MKSWPRDYADAWTLTQEVERCGTGLHSGLSSSVLLVPSERPGIHLSFDDGQEPIRLRPDQVRDSQLCTTLELGNRRVATVEHLLAALAGCAVSHVEIRLRGDEVPLLDGSAQDGLMPLLGSLTLPPVPVQCRPGWISLSCVTVAAV